MHPAVPDQCFESTFRVGANRMEIWPQIKVEKRLRNGPEDNVWHYFQLTVQKLAAQ